MRKIVEQSIAIYNNKRPHWSCYYKTPNETHVQKSMKIRSYRKKTSSKTMVFELV